MKQVRKTHNFEWPISGFSLGPVIPLLSRKQLQGEAKNMGNHGQLDANHQLLIAGVPARLLLSSNAFGGAVLDEHGRFLDVNQKAADLFACGQEKILHKTFFCWLVSGDVAKFMAYLRQIFRSPNYPRTAIEVHVQLDDGHFRELRLECVGVGVTKALHYRCLITMTDITDLKTARQAHRLSEQLFHEIQEGVIVMDGQGAIQSVNRAFEQATGYAEADVAGRTLASLEPGQPDKNFYREVWKIIEDTGEWHGEIWSHRKSGEAYPVWLSIKAITNEDSKVSQYLGIFADISVTGVTLQRLQYLAYYDALTGLPNRRLFIDRFNSALSQARRNGLLVAVMFMDIDNFKAVNDTRGHSVGDRLLVMAAARFKACLREEDTIARFGGDEFTVILPLLSHAEAAASVAMKIQQSFAQPFVIDGVELSTTVSMGISTYPHDGENAGQLLGCADKAMYQVKKNSHESFRFFRKEALPRKLTM